MAFTVTVIRPCLCLRKVGRSSRTFPGNLYVVNWDTGQQSVHYHSNFMRKCFFQSQMQAAHWTEFEADSVMVDAVGVKKVLGPQGGIRSYSIHLRNGDWVLGDYDLEERLKAANVPIEMEQIAPKRKGRPPRKI